MTKFFKAIIGFLTSIVNFIIDFFEFIGEFFSVLQPIGRVFGGLFTLDVIGWVYVMITVLVTLFIIIDLCRDLI